MAGIKPGKQILEEIRGMGQEKGIFPEVLFNDYMLFSSGDKYSLESRSKIAEGGFYLKITQTTSGAVIPEPLRETQGLVSIEDMVQSPELRYDVDFEYWQLQSGSDAEGNATTTPRSIAVVNFSMDSGKSKQLLASPLSATLLGIDAKYVVGSGHTCRVNMEWKPLVERILDHYAQRLKS